MTTKTAIIATVASIVGVIGLGIILIVATVDITAAGAEEKASSLGRLVGFVTAVPLGVIWVKWAIDQRNAREAPAKKRTKTKRRPVADDE